jgi:hypothetical protein
MWQRLSPNELANAAHASEQQIRTIKLIANEWVEQVVNINNIV